MQPPERASTITVCTNGPCRGNGAQATLKELEELASLVEPAGSCNVVQYKCFGHCGRGPNVSIGREGGHQEMVHRVCSTDMSLGIIHRASGVRLKPDPPLAARLQYIRRVAGLEQELMEVQADMDVLDVSPLAQRSSADGQKRYDNSLARVDRVLQESPANAHPRRLAEAVRRQVVAARAGRPASPEVEDILADDPDTWPGD